MSVFLSLDSPLSSNSVISGTSGNDNLIGTSGDDWIDIDWNTDTINIDGGAGFDTLRYGDFSSLTTPVTINELGTTTINLPDGSSISNIEWFYSFKTGSGNDVISFTEHLDNNIDTGSGDDTINPGGGYNVVNGGEGNDLLIVDYSSNTYTGENAGIQSNYNFKAYYDSSNNYDYVQYSNIERFNITGTIVDDWINIGWNTDTINIDGRAGFDTLRYGDFSSLTTPVTINELGTTTINLPDGSSISNIEWFYSFKTGSGNDVISFTEHLDNNIDTGSGDDTINPGGGYNVVNGGEGNDLLIVDYSSNTYTGENAGIQNYNFKAYYDSSNNYDYIQYSNIERFNVIGTIADDYIQTGDGNDTVIGSEGSDEIYAGDGSDRLTGVSPNNTLPGLGEIDLLDGGEGGDIYLLGDGSKTFYDDGNNSTAGLDDYAQIIGFNANTDRIQLRGVKSDYFLASSPITDISGTAIYLDKSGSEPDELIAIIEDVTGLDINSDAFFTIPTIVIPSYHAKVYTDTEIGTNGQSVFLQGSAINNKDNSPASFEFVTIRIENNGIIRELNAFTDANGHFTKTFNPLPTEGGEYKINAYFPNYSAEDSEPEDTFKLLGMAFDQNQVTHKITADTPFTGSVILENLTNIELTGITATLESVIAGWDIKLNTSSVLNGLEKNTLAYTITVPDTAYFPQDTFSINVTSTEGVTATLPVTVNLEQNTPRLVASTDLITQGMLRGDQTFVEFEVTNEGGNLAKNIKILLPNEPWLKLVSPDTIATLNPEESTKITLLLSPDANLPLTEYTGNLLLDSEGNEGDLSVNFKFRAVSDAVGNLIINTVDELFYFAEGSPKLANATLTLRDYFTDEIVATAITDDTGLVNFSSLKEGFYNLEIKADRHDTFRQTVQLNAGETENINAFLSRQTVQYNWRVVPTEIEDKYNISIESVFETNVPIPTVVIDPPLIDLQELQTIGQVMQVNLTITNYGLISANDIQLNFDEHPFYKIEPLVNQVASLGAKSSLTIPVTITKIADFSTIDSNNVQLQALTANSDNIPCTIKAGITHEYKCSDYNVKLFVPVPFINVQGNCITPPNSGDLTTIIDYINFVGSGLIKYYKSTTKNQSNNPSSPTPTSTSNSQLLSINLPSSCNPCVHQLLNALPSCINAVAGGYSGNPTAILSAIGCGSKIPQLIKNCYGYYISDNNFNSLSIQTQNVTELVNSTAKTGLETYLLQVADQITEYVNKLENIIDPEAQIEEITQIFQSLESIFDETLNVLEGENEGVCAQVRLKIDQEAVMTRSAFLGTLEIDNSNNNNLENISITLQIKDENGNLVNNLFGINNPILNKITAIDGTGILTGDDPNTPENEGLGSAEWTFIPTNLAAPQTPTTYNISGTLSYTENGQAIAVPLLSTPITVLPQAELYLDYFQSRNVYGDDPFTDTTEISVPFDLAVLVRNQGYGDAKNLQITSSQPKIIENEKGLLIDFNIIGSQLNGEDITPSLSVNFGDLKAGETAVADWLLESSLQGKFIEYQATFEHLNSLGNQELSLIKDIKIHELIHKVKADSDNLPDFLVNDQFDAKFYPDTLYFSDGSTAPVTAIDNVIVDAPVTIFDLESKINLEKSGLEGYTYIRLEDPADEQFNLQKIIRSDGTEVNPENIWRTDRTFPATGKPTYENILHFLDFNSTGSYTIVYDINDVNTTFDIDGDGKYLAAVDGLLFYGYVNIRSLPSPQLVNNLTQQLADNLINPDSGATRTSGQAIASYLENNPEMMDIDGDGQISANIDGLLAYGYLNIRGLPEDLRNNLTQQLADNLIPDVSNATRTSGIDIANFIDNYLML